jgi:hypothetical protein
MTYSPSVGPSQLWQSERGGKYIRAQFLYEVSYGYLPEEHTTLCQLQRTNQTNKLLKQSCLEKVRLSVAVIEMDALFV